MKFYDCKVAPSPRRAKIFMAEKGITLDVIEIDLAKNDHLSDEFKKINPLCTVPVLQLDDGTIICENDGISNYLEEIYPDPPLLGKNPVEKGQVAMWNAIVNFEGFIPIQNSFRNKVKGLKDRPVTGPINYPQIPELVERGKKRAQQFFKLLNERLSGREYLATDSFSVADISCFVMVDFAKWIKLEIGKEQIQLKRWYDQISSRKSCNI